MAEGLPSTNSFGEDLSAVMEGIEFSAIPPNKAAASGSMRYKRGFDPIAGCGVVLTEFVGLFDNGDGEGYAPAHRMSAVWDNGEIREFDLDRNIIIYSPEEIDTCDAAEDYARLMGAVDAVRNEG